MALVLVSPIRSDDTIMDTLMDRILAKDGTTHEVPSNLY